jgi:hypothetical protein
MIEEELAVARHDVENGHHVRVPHSRREPRLVEEHLGEFLVLREVRVQALHRHRPRKPHLTDQSPVPNRRHPTGSDLVEQHVAADDARGLWSVLGHHGSLANPPVRRQGIDAIV